MVYKVHYLYVSPHGGLLSGEHSLAAQTGKRLKQHLEHIVAPLTLYSFVAYPEKLGSGIWKWDMASDRLRKEK